MACATQAAHRPDPVPGSDLVADVLKRWAAKQPKGEKQDECTVYVASDSDNAVKAMRSALDGKSSGPCAFKVTGLMEYWAHHHKQDGWLGKLKDVEGRWAARDILFDIHTLSRSDVLVGSRSSPVVRAAARVRAALRPDLAKAQPPIALDLTGAPDAEGFAAPPPV